MTDGLKQGFGFACFSCINWMDRGAAAGLVEGPNRPRAADAQLTAA
jgi:hypothetical protein